MVIVVKIYIGSSIDICTMIYETATHLEAERIGCHYRRCEIPVRLSGIEDR